MINIQQQRRAFAAEWDALCREEGLEYMAHWGGDEIWGQAQMLPAAQRARVLDYLRRWFASVQAEDEVR